jgi:hypothetical protein
VKALLVALLVFATSVFAQDRSTYIPARAHEHLPAVRAQIQELWPDFFAPNYIPALIEHESCLSLTHSRCWSPTSQLKTHREEGAGLGQLTRAYRQDGSIRFDALAEARRLDPRGLNELRWETVYQRADLQIRVIVLMSRHTWNRLKSLVPQDEPRLAMADAAYNGGLGGLLDERRACALKAGCDPNLWFGHVEHTCQKSRKPLYGTRSACDINRHHVHDVLNVRMSKYKGLV